MNCSFNKSHLILQKVKERTCFVCGKSPRPESIFCSDECIGKHVDSAKEFLMKTKPKSVPTSKRVNILLYMKPMESKPNKY